VLVAQPAAMSHGLTLVAANTIVWYAPVTSNETYEQANGRITRPGQKHQQFIINIEGTAIERKIYDRLRNKQKTQGLLLDLVQEDFDKELEQV
jgi:SNF2 family DNA or RNA helicase